MKSRIVIFMVLVSILCASCAKNGNHVNYTTGADFQTIDVSVDKIMISYMSSSYLLTVTDEAVINELKNCYNALVFEPTEDKIDATSMYEIIFLQQGEIVSCVFMDNNGVFWVSGKPGAYKIKTGEIEYNRIAEIFEAGKQSDIG